MLGSLARSLFGTANDRVVKGFDKPVAKLVPFNPAKADRKPGLLAGQITIKPGFDELPPGFEVFGE